MGSTVERYLKRQAQLKASSGGGNTWNPKEDVNGVVQNKIRAFMFQHKVTKEDVKLGLFAKDEEGKTVSELYREVKRQFGLTSNNAPVFSTAQTLAAYDALNNSKDPVKKKQGEAIKPQVKHAVNILDLDDPAKGIQIWLAPKSIITPMVDLLVDKDFGESVFGASGRDFKISFDKKREPAKMYTHLLLDKDKCKKFPEAAQKKVKDMYDPNVYMTFAQVFAGDDVTVRTKEEEVPAVTEAPAGNGNAAATTDEELFGQ